MLDPHAHPPGPKQAVMLMKEVRNQEFSCTNAFPTQKEHWACCTLLILTAMRAAGPWHEGQELLLLHPEEWDQS